MKLQLVCLNATAETGDPTVLRVEVGEVRMTGPIASPVGQAVLDLFANLGRSVQQVVDQHGGRIEITPIRPDDEADRESAEVPAARAKAAARRTPPEQGK